MATSNTFSLYLAKSTTTNFDDLLTEKAKSMVRSGHAHIVPSKDFGEGAKLYVFPGRTYPPKWVQLIEKSFRLPVNLLSQSPSALVAFKEGDSIFAVTFSYAHVYLDDSKTEADFGLKIAINAISDEKLRSVERSNIGAAIRDFAQAAGQRDLRSFGFDDALDLIRKVSGRASQSDFAEMVTGSRALRFTKKIELADIPQAATNAVKFFKSTAYKKTAFRIIDFLSPVLDPEIEENLNEELVTSIIQDRGEFEISIPAILPEAVGTFRFEHAGFHDFHADLSLSLYREGLDEELESLTVDALKHHTVAAYSLNDGRPFDYWTVHEALIGSLLFRGERYALNEGSWYRISKTLRNAADKKFQELKTDFDKKLRTLKKIAEPKEKGKKVKISYQSEESYNAEISRETDYLLMDKKLIQIDEVPGPGIELCDLLDIAGCRFIHIKKSSR